MGIVFLEVVDRVRKRFGLTHGFGGHVLDRWQELLGFGQAEESPESKLVIHPAIIVWTCFPSGPARARAPGRDMSGSPSG